MGVDIVNAGWALWKPPYSKRYDSVQLECRTELAVPPTPVKLII